MASRLGSVQRMLLLFALAVGIVVMHHVPAPSGAHAMSGQMTVAESHGDVAAPIRLAEPAPGHAANTGMPGGEHSMLHLCLAVLLAAGTLVVAMVAFRRYVVAAATPVGSRGSPAADRPPDKRGRSVLTSLCVLRT